MPRKGPPEAVRIIFLQILLPPRFQGLENSGMLGVDRQQANPFSLTAAMTILPAMTRVSLLARPISLPASMAARVGRSPAAPTIAETVISAAGKAATELFPSSPKTILVRNSSGSSRLSSLPAVHRKRKPAPAEIPSPVAPEAMHIGAGRHGDNPVTLGKLSYNRKDIDTDGAG